MSADGVREVSYRTELTAIAIHPPEVPKSGMMAASMSSGRGPRLLVLPRRRGRPAQLSPSHSGGKPPAAIRRAYSRRWITPYATNPRETAMNTASYETVVSTACHLVLVDDTQCKGQGCFRPRAPSRLAWRASLIWRVADAHG
jgi:hypothetical protein